MNFNTVHSSAPMSQTLTRNHYTYFMYQVSGKSMLISTVVFPHFNSNVWDLQQTGQTRLIKGFPHIHGDSYGHNPYIMTASIGLPFQLWVDREWAHYRNKFVALDCPSRSNQPQRRTNHYHILIQSLMNCYNCLLRFLSPPPIKPHHSSWLNFYITKPV